MAAHSPALGREVRGYALDVAEGTEERESLDHVLHRKHVDWKRAARGEPEEKRREMKKRFTESRFS